jgi:hypothetical protein
MRPAIPRGVTTLALLRDARTTGVTIVAVDHLLQLGYAPIRADRASQPYADPVTRVYRLLSRADQEAAAQAASDVAIERRIDREARPLAWVYLQIAVAAEVAEATLDALEEALDEVATESAAEVHRLLEAATDRACSLWQDSGVWR